jgi:hypothetical protein
MKKLLVIATIVLAGLATTSCDSYLDINQSPDSPTEGNMTSSIMMPAAEMNLVASYGDFLRIAGGYHAQYYSQYFGTSNYLDYSQFNMSATRSSSTYTQLMSRTLKSLDQILKMSRQQQEWGTYLAATTLKAFTYQVLVDCYGEVPYTEAMQDLNNMSPKYDDGTMIYDAMIDSLDNAMAHIETGEEKVCTNILYPSEDPSDLTVFPISYPWYQFASALKLRMLMRESKVKDVKEQVAAIIEEGMLPDEDIQYAGIWKEESGQANPFYSEEEWSKFGSTQKNVIANIALIGTMIQTVNGQGYEDPRLSKMFKKGDYGWAGGVSGTNFSTTKQYKASYWCRPRLAFDDPVYFITVAEIDFFLAEYYASIGDHVNAEKYYNEAIESSFDTYEVDGADEYVALFPYDATNYQKCIGVAKWVALAGINTFEGWCEVRRLGYPAFGTVIGDDIYNEDTDAYTPEKYVPGTLYTPIKVFNQVGSGKLLQRYPYPESSSARNGNTPAFPGYTAPVFWAK